MFDNCLTRNIKLSKTKQFYLIKNMKQKYATIREFVRNYKVIMGKKQITIISVNGQPKGVYVPYQEWEKEAQSKQEEMKKNPPKKFTLENLEPFIFHGGPPNLSQMVDEVCYPYPNKLKNDRRRQ